VIEANNKPTTTKTVLSKIDQSDGDFSLKEAASDPRLLEIEMAERKLAIEQLRRREHELRDFIENSMFALCWVGPDGTILWANQAELDLLGYSKEEYIGRHIAEFHLDRKVVDDVLRRFAENETLRDYEARLRSKDGSIRHVLINSDAYCENGEFVHTRCFTRDISERKLGEAASARLAAIVASSSDAIISKTLQGIITSWNASAERMFGFTAQEIIGESIVRLIPDDRREEEEQILRRLRAGELIDHYETVRVTKDGRRLDVSLTISPIKDSAGKIIGASKIIRDVTEHKRVEEEQQSLIERERTARAEAETATA